MADLGLEPLSALSGPNLSSCAVMLRLRRTQLFTVPIVAGMHACPHPPEMGIDLDKTVADLSCHLYS